MLQNIKISGKLSILTIFTSIAIVVFGVIAYNTVETTKIKSDLYNQISLGKDLIADILPPPEYIIESYLIANELENCTDQVKTNEFLKRVEDLHKEFNDRHSFWLINLPEGELKQTLVINSFNYADEFYKIFESEFKSAILEKNLLKAEFILENKLKPVYEKHRTEINKTVTLAMSENSKLEESSDKLVSKSILIMVIIGFLALILSVTLSIIITKSIVNPIHSLNDITKKLASGDFSFLKK